MWTRLLTGIVTAGIVMAGVVLWRFRPLRRLRWVVAAVGTYGVIAFLYALLTGITLRDALAGHGLTASMPHVLQGTFLAGLLLLPLGWIVSGIRLGVPRLRAPSTARAVSQ